MKKRMLLPIFATFMLLAAPIAQNVEAATPNEVTATASKYIGTPYRYGGTTASGFDCSGFTQKVFSELGISLTRTTSSQYAQGTSVSKSNLEVGDLVFFNTSGRGVSHVGIYVGNNSFTHASSSKGITTSKLSESYWATRYIGAKRIAEFTEAPAKVAEPVAKQEVKPAAIDFTVYASRAEVAMQLAEALGVDTTDKSANFSDVKPTDKYAGAVAALQDAKIFTGDAGKFNPNSPITRAQIAKVLVEAFDLEVQAVNTLKFNDVAKSDWANDYITNLASNKVTIGKAEGLYGPNDHVTLKQLKTFIERAENL
ncbi:NlpC/P60 family protein [Ureibacillus chungkukjangi]|uniref:C40 family peptidase n=1 Tax=Ureibacillus chungkukjangi TaxID=1202712 RepID=UPI0038501200